MNVRKYVPEHTYTHLYIFVHIYTHLNIFICILGMFRGSPQEHNIQYFADAILRHNIKKNLRLEQIYEHCSSILETSPFLIFFSLLFFSISVLNLLLVWISNIVSQILHQKYWILCSCGDPLRKNPATGNSFNIEFV